MRTTDAQLQARRVIRDSGAKRLRGRAEGGRSGGGWMRSRRLESTRSAAVFLFATTVVANLGDEHEFLRIKLGVS